MRSSELERLIRPPTTLKVELTRGCQLRCTFCPVAYRPSDQLRGSDAVPDERASPAGVREICRQYAEIVPKKQKIELASRGEPTLNPDAPACVRAMRDAFPRAQISLFTNGVKFLGNASLAVELVDAGVNFLNVECYNGTESRFRELLAPLADANGLTLSDFGVTPAYRRWSGGWRKRVVNLIPDIKVDASIPSRQLHNWAGSVPTPPELERRLPLERMCTKPFRELVVYVNGDVPICCLDWKGEAILGNMRDQSLKRIWYSRAHLDLLRSLYNRNRSGRLCNRCTEKSGFHVYQLRNPFTGGRWKEK